MHLRSTINQLTTSNGNVPVAIFNYERKRKFIQISESYEETIQRVSSSFGIKEAQPRVLVLRTSAIDACRGEEVEIDPSAYPHLLSVLGEVTVVLEERENVPVPGNGLPKVGGNNPLPTPSATPLVGSVQVQVDVAVAGPSNAKAAEAPPKEKNKPVPEEQQGYFDAEPPEEEYEDEEELLRAQEEAPLKPAAGGSRLLDKLDEIASQGEPQKKFKASMLPPVVTNTEFPKPVKKEKVPHAEPSPAVETSSPRKAAAGAQSDDRFEITINGPAPNQSAQFKTRGKHVIKKVLAAACKTFDIDEQSARLFLLMSVPDDDGTVLTHEFECPPDDSIARCGIDKDAKLFVRFAKEVPGRRAAEADEDEDE
ncbi:unnamed protein product [Cyclocybe aegerita]|uniref:Uncharacterized protein n=1 Tax=Cyclocybe aegerita TaxID=1973307 RepID=A0A8S0XI56_CYCAE|nr:unnamed protein product [Cyclocybe aegerita]